MPNAPAERVTYGGDPQQFFELWRPAEKSLGVAVMIHGGFWRAKYDLEHVRPFCAALAAKGVTIANLEYRRVGQRGGGWPGTFEDVVAGVAAAGERLGGAPVVIGHSAGGHLALRLASEPLTLRAVVALAPVADLRLAYDLNLSNGAVGEFLGASPENRPDLYDDACPSGRTSSFRRLLVHGTADEDVPVSISRAFLEARKRDPEPPSLLEIPNAGHMDLIDPESAAAVKIVEVVLRLMAPI